MTARSAAPPDPERNWQSIALRVLAATILGYFLIYWLGSAIASFLPMQRSEIVYLIGLLQITAYTPLVLWIFLARSVPRMLTIMVVATALSGIVTLLHGHG